jgi:hypothetical protein
VAPSRRLVFNITMGSLTTPGEMRRRRKLSFSVPRLNSTDQQAWSWAVGYGSQFKLQDTLKDLAHRMRRYLAGGSGESADWGAADSKVALR